MKKVLLLPLLLSGGVLWAAYTIDTCENIQIDENRSRAAHAIKLCEREIASSGENEIRDYRLALAYEMLGEYRSAYQWFVKSARRGYPKAYRELAMMVAKGRGVKQDDDLALRLYLRATRPDNVDYFLDKGSHTRSYSADEMLELYSKITIGSLLQEARSENPDAYLHLADAFENGRYGARKNRSKAFYWYMKAARKNETYAKIKLAKLCLGGTGTQGDCEEVFGWIAKLAELGSPEAQYLTGVRLFKGVNTTEDYEQALYWFVKSAEQNNTDADYMVKMIYRHKAAQERQKVQPKTTERLQ